MCDLYEVKGCLRDQRNELTRARNRHCISDNLATAIENDQLTPREIGHVTDIKSPSESGTLKELETGPG